MPLAANSFKVAAYNIEFWVSSGINNYLQHFKNILLPDLGNFQTNSLGTLYAFLSGLHCQLQTSFPNLFPNLFNLRKTELVKGQPSVPF